MNLFFLNDIGVVPEQDLLEKNCPIKSQDFYKNSKKVSVRNNIVKKLAEGFIEFRKIGDKNRHKTIPETQFTLFNSELDLSTRGGSYN